MFIKTNLNFAPYSLTLFCPDANNPKLLRAGIRRGAFIEFTEKGSSTRELLTKSSAHCLILTKKLRFAEIKIGGRCFIRFASTTDASHYSAIKTRQNMVYIDENSSGTPISADNLVNVPATGLKIIKFHLLNLYSTFWLNTKTECVKQSEKTFSIKSAAGVMVISSIDPERLVCNPI